MPIRTLIFDLDNTLVDRESAFRQWLTSVFAERSIADAVSLIDEIVVFNNFGYAPFREVFIRLADMLGMQGREEELRHRLIAEISSYVQPNPDVIGLMSSLSGYELAILTNGGRKNQQSKIINAGLDKSVSPDHIFISEVIGCRKPAPEAFAYALESLARPADSCLMIGDDPVNDIVGAKAIGMRTCWISHGRSFPEEHAKPDKILESVLQLPEILNRW